MTEVWGHRGAKGYCPENTMISFEEAKCQGADGIELDVHLSNDGYLMVCHDELVDRTTNGTGLIKNMSFDELRKLDAGSYFNEKFKGQKMPILNEVFDFLKNNNMKLNIEIKAGSIFYHDIEEKVINLVDLYGLKDRVIISSFDHYAVVKIKEIDKSFKTGILYSEALYKPLEYMKTALADALHPDCITITRELAAEAKERNVDINTYTVNDMKVAIQLYHMGINAIITDYPKDAICAINKTKTIL